MRVRATAFCLMLVTGVGVCVVALVPHEAATVDTRFQSGVHVTFTFVAPTSGGTDELRERVDLARRAVRHATLEAGLLYSTVGISEEWSIDRGLEIIREFGTFDELIVGRNWFNTGVKSYITDMRGRAGVPQIIVSRQEVVIDRLPWSYGPRYELVRLVGRKEIDNWELAGFPMPSMSERDDRSP